MQTRGKWLLQVAVPLGVLAQWIAPRVKCAIFRRCADFPLLSLGLRLSHGGDTGSVPSMGQHDGAWSIRVHDGIDNEVLNTDYPPVRGLDLDSCLVAIGQTSAGQRRANVVRHVVETQAMAELYRQGMKYRDIGVMLGRSKTEVGRRIKAGEVSWWPVDADRASVVAEVERAWRSARVVGHASVGVEQVPRNILMLLWDYAAEVAAQEVYDDLTQATEQERFNAVTLHPGDPFGRIVTDAWCRNPNDAVTIVNTYVETLRHLTLTDDGLMPSLFDLFQGLRMAFPDLSIATVDNELLPYLHKNIGERQGAGLTGATDLSCSYAGCGRTAPGVELLEGDWLMVDGTTYCPEHNGDPIEPTPIEHQGIVDVETVRSLPPGTAFVQSPKPGEMTVADYVRVATKGLTFALCLETGARKPQREAVELVVQCQQRKEELDAVMQDWNGVDLAAVQAVADRWTSAKSGRRPVRIIADRSERDSYGRTNGLRNDSNKEEI